MKKGLKILLVLMMVSIAAFFVIAMSLSQSFNAMSPRAYMNISKTTQLNLTLVNNQSSVDNLNVTSVTFMFSNVSDRWMYNTSLVNTSDNNQFNFSNNSFNTALLADGVYNITVNISNVSTISVLNESDVTCLGCGYNITIDNTNPSVTINTSTTPAGLVAVNGSNFSASKGNVSINVSIFDIRPTGVGVATVSGTDGLYVGNLFNISTVVFVFDNGTGADFNLSSRGSVNTDNKSVENVSGVWTVSYNLSSLFEGKQGVIIYANDTHNNTAAVIFNFTIDRTAPTITLATSSIGTDTAKVTATLNESVSNCTYISLVGGVGSGNFSVTTAGTLTSYSKTFSGLTASTSYQVEVTCTDFVGYTVTGGTSWATTAAAAAASNGGGGSGGSSGGVSANVQGQVAKEIWTSINAGETATVDVKNGALGVTEVSFSVPATVYGAWVQVAKKDSLPSTVSSFSGEVYRNLEISKGPALNKEGAFTDATVKFKVEKAWLAEKKLAKEAVALHHYENGVWSQLSTSVGEDDGTYVHYSAKTPGFSYFVIGQKSGAAVAEVPTEAPAVGAPTEEATPALGEPAMEGKSGSKTWLLLLLAAVVVVVAVVVYLKKRR